MKINSHLMFAWMIVVLTMLLVLGLEMAVSERTGDRAKQETVSPFKELHW